jgi:hypothetical protein
MMAIELTVKCWPATLAHFKEWADCEGQPLEGDKPERCSMNRVIRDKVNCLRLNNVAGLEDCIWKPVLPTDWGRPVPSITSNVADPRATYYWDPEHRLSSLYGGRDNLTNLASTTEIGSKCAD